MARDTGFSRADAENDFLRMRRRQVLSRLAAWLRREPDDVGSVSRGRSAGASRYRRSRFTA